MSETTPSAPLSLLIVDDEPDIIELLQAVLEDEGFTVLTASNGAAALYLVRRTSSIQLRGMGLTRRAESWLSGFPWMGRSATSFKPLSPTIHRLPTSS